MREYQTLEIRHDAPLSLITLNRPEKRNAISFEMIGELLQALEDCESRWRTGGLRALALTGAGKAFCSGMDLETLRSLTTASPEAQREDSRRMAELFLRLYRFPAPTIAAVNGAAVAGGCGLASVCDFTLAAPEAKFGYTEVKVGYMPALVTVYLLRQIGEKRARDLLLTGRLISAAQALDWGMIGEIAPAGELAARTRELAARLAENSPLSLAATKRLIERLPQEQALNAALEMAAGDNAAMRLTADFREGVAAFLEKRPPAWAAPRKLEA